MVRGAGRAERLGEWVERGGSACVLPTCTTGMRAAAGATRSAAAGARAARSSVCTSMGTRGVC
eukprot:scaffold188551_cov32-Tisochrysis_lutea.AAC.1